MIDFEETYLHRRSVYRAVQQSQKSESLIAERIYQFAVLGKRELLLLLSAWLLGLDAVKGFSGVERAEMEQVTSISFDDWIKLQGVAAQLGRDIIEAEARDQESKAALQEKTPYGVATVLFTDAESKTKIRTLQQSVAGTQKHREGLATALRQNEAKRRSLGEAFFRDCLSHLDLLAKTQALGNAVTAIIGRMNYDINAVWLQHQKQQTEEFVQMAELVETLRVSYKDMPQALPQQDKPVYLEQPQDKPVA